MTMPCPPNPPPPAGTIPWPASRAVTQAIKDWARAQLHYEKGTIITANVGGVDVVGRLETHYHPPGGNIRPWGCHKGLTIYAPSGSVLVSYGVQSPPAAELEPPGATFDEWIDAGGKWVSTAVDIIDWPTAVVSTVLGILAGWWWEKNRGRA
jgi:hypothetical protein